VTGPLYGDCHGCGQQHRLTKRGLVYRHNHATDRLMNCSGSGRAPIRPVRPARVPGAATVHLPDPEVTP
jgi:hypothetical protein